MTHFVGIVVADDEKKVAALLAPFDEGEENAKWDWYVVGGRWADMVPGNTCLVSELATYFTEYTPAVLVDDAGWHADKDYGWFGSSQDAETKGVVAVKIAEHADRRCFVVDFHGA